ncbi:MULTISPECIES: hypothetical protein [Micrococcaceae]|uniref:hypothetical protein n=1 Tax=Micrococcaceae TaxID=1268 RepID=UPI001036E289|nr:MULTISPECIES: hypothetical protein [Micrococcaceae]TAP25953.1 hypothetical protein EYR88_13475 [Arthrobacter sp. S41]UXN31874.1 DNA polymerase V family protein [Glutamicibacter sp. M10]
MGVDWAALEEAIRVTALRHAAEVITGHPDQDFYAIALHGVSTEESESIAMPLLALNSVQALERDRVTASREELVERGEDADEPADYEDREDAEPGSSTESEDVTIDDDSIVISDADEQETDEEDSSLNDDEEDLDQVLASLEEGLDADDSESFYSDKWEPSDWHWSAIDLCEDPAATLWSDAMTDLAAHEGWEVTIKRYYRTLVAVAQSLREELQQRTPADLVCYVADEDHAEKLLRLCLTDKQLSKYFPQLAQLVEGP